MKKTLLIALFSSFVILSKSQIYTAKKDATSIGFFSDAPLEDIEATNKDASIVFKGSSNEIQIRIPVQNFKFKNSLMEEHFNENYMETEKKVMVDGNATYPNRYSEFKGKVNEAVDYTKDGETKVTITGKLTIHGTTKDVTLSGTMTKVGNELKLLSKFKVKVADYNIKVPSMYVKNIAEEVDVTFSTTLEPYQKK